MQEIEFRAWDKTGTVPRMVYWDELKQYSCEAVFLPTIQPHLMEMMQFIGKRDMHGRKIFAGDICRYNHSAPKHNLPLCYTGVVKWREDAAKFIVSCEPNQDIIWSVIEVIGNIYENPQLLAAA